jgi:hypothetical protein
LAAKISPLSVALFWGMCNCVCLMLHDIYIVDSNFVNFVSSSDVVRVEATVVEKTLTRPLIRFYYRRRKNFRRFKC